MHRLSAADVGPRVKAPAAGSEDVNLVLCQRAAAGPGGQRAANQAVERLCVCMRVCEWVLKSIRMAGWWQENDLLNCSAHL